MGALIGGAGGAEAQMVFRPERPYRGLFGSGAGAGLSLNASAGIGYDNNLIADATGRQITKVPGDRQPPGGALALGSVSLDYSMQDGPVVIGTSAVTITRYYPSLDDKFLRAVAGNFRLATPLWPRATLSLTAIAAHQPYTAGALFGGAFGREDYDFEGPPPDLDLAVTQQNYTSYGGQARLNHQIARRTSVFGRYAYRTSETPGRLEPFVNQSLSAGINHGLTLAKGLTLSGGYSRGVMQRSDGSEVPIDNLHVGLNYNRALSFSRNTTLAFSTGSAIVHTRNSSHFNFLGHVSLTHEIGRSWTTSVSYARTVLMHELYQEPVLSDALVGRLTGLLSRRLNFNAEAGTALGQVIADGDRPRFRSYRASSTLAYALTRFMSAGAVYAYYSHAYPQETVLPEGVPVYFHRHSVRGVVSFWMPLWQGGGRN